MRLATRPHASKWRPGLLRFVMIVVAGVTGFSVQPAWAGRDYGFVDEGSPASKGETANSGHELFRTRAIAIPTNRFRDKWDGLLRSLKAANVFEMCGGTKRTCNGAANRWLSYLATLRALPKTEQIILVNRYINWHIRYANDNSAYGARDYWATPLQSIGGRGDCEDFASAKYFSLISLGFSDDQMRVVIVRDLNTGELHAVVTIAIGDQIYVLDNRSERVLRDSDVLSIYRPIYSFNQSQNWMHMSRSG